MIYNRYQKKLKTGTKHTKKFTVKKTKKQKINKNTTHRSKTSNITH